jgi:hypothetical protein
LAQVVLVVVAHVAIALPVNRFQVLVAAAADMFLLKFPLLPAVHVLLLLVLFLTEQHVWELKLSPLVVPMPALLADALVIQVFAILLMVRWVALASVEVLVLLV